MNQTLLGHHFGDPGDEVILTLNGGMMTYASWQPVTTGLPATYRILGCDFRGQLLSPGDAHPRLIDNVADLVALLDALALHAVHLLATSFGAEIALLLAALHPQRVRSLTAVTAVDRTPTGMPKNAREMRAMARDILAGGDPGPFHDTLVRDVYSAAYRQAHAAELAARRARLAELPRSYYQGLLGILTSIEDFDLTPWLAKITCPTLVVQATEDAVMPAERVRALASAIDGAELRIHPTAGHVLVAEDPAWLAAVVGEFLTRQTRSAAAVPQE